MSKHIELGKKLKALADKGVGGEKINAEKMLNDLLKKHNLTIEDIEGEKQENYFFMLKEDEHRLWGQIVAHVNHKINCYGEFPKAKVKSLKLKGNYMAFCAASEYIEIQSKYDFYSKLYKSELKIFYAAFIKSNSLYPKTDGIDVSTLTKEQKEELMRVEEMAQKIKKGNFLKQLN